jgi:uncharacterized protein YgiM (DUF1202 family)
VKRLVISLFLVGGIVCLLATAVATRISATGGENEKAAISPSSAIDGEMAATSATDPIDSPSTRRTSPHAISVDQPPAGNVDATPTAPRDNAASSSPPDKQEQPSAPSAQQSSAEANTTPSPQEAEPTDTASQSGSPEFVKVTSMTEVRNGPGDSSQIIGTARRGAVAEVLAHESGWVRIRDPASSNTGWISADSVASVAGDEQQASAEVEDDSPPSVTRGESKQRHVAVRRRPHWRGRVVFRGLRIFFR